MSIFENPIVLSEDFKNGSGKINIKKRKKKISVYKVVVLTKLIYGSDSWVFYQRHIKLLENSH